MDRYVRIERPRPVVDIKENEILIMATGKMRNYITDATALLEEKHFDTIVFKGMGRAINKAVTIAEITKRRVLGLHQSTEISSTDIVDTWEPLEEGLHRLETKRSVSEITVTLSKNQLDSSSPGYQAPLPADQVVPLLQFEQMELGLDRGGRKNRHQATNDEQHNGGDIGRRGGRRRPSGRGGHGSYRSEADGDLSGYHQSFQVEHEVGRGDDAQRRARGRGRRGGRRGGRRAGKEGGHAQGATGTTPFVDAAHLGA
mmetsp:Transcript_35/g.65  ORF Transcript_35/g.65 Transcript_35/m.65 type:complete len:257 (-) Transcript_35:293-1063(-)